MTRKAMRGTSSPAALCEWCGARATTTVEVEPIRATRSETHDLPILAAACAKHADVTESHPDPATIMRKHAKGVEQLSILDPPGPGNAIHGDAA